MPARLSLSHIMPHAVTPDPEASLTVNPVAQNGFPVADLDEKAPLIAEALKSGGMVSDDGTASFSDIEKVLEKQNLSWRMIGYALIFSLLLQFAATIGGTYATASFAQTLQASNGVLSNKNGEPIATASMIEFKDINSEMPPSQLQGIERINMVVGEGEKQASTSVVVRGFSQETCTDACTSKHLVNFYTSEGTFVYHGNEAYVADPSPEFQKILEAHGMIQADGQTPAGAVSGRRKLWAALGRAAYSFGVHFGSWYGGNKAWEYGQKRNWWR